jgi:hypothetical protein
MRILSVVYVNLKVARNVHNFPLDALILFFFTVVNRLHDLRQMSIRKELFFLNFMNIDRERDVNVITRVRLTESLAVLFREDHPL